MSRRDAILQGAQAAARLHDKLKCRELVETNGGGVDVFGALIHEHAALLFRPLDGLLGFCVKGPDIPGVVISTQRGLRIQRFTGSHELGHVVLGHTLSLDGPEILERGGESSSELEIAADSFASAFLLPKWLLQVHARRQGWGRTHMADPHIVYQLALRAGASYHATCVALERHQIIDTATRERLVSKPRRDIKVELLNGVQIDKYYADVWLLTERDEGSRIEGEPGDLFILKLDEKGSAGYLWDTATLVQSGFAILRDERAIPPAASSIGGSTLREVTTQHVDKGKGTIELEQTRPWESAASALSRLRVPFDLDGKEVGMPRAVRRQLLAA